MTWKLFPWVFWSMSCRSSQVICNMFFSKSPKNLKSAKKTPHTWTNKPTNQPKSSKPTTKQANKKNLNKPWNKATKIDSYSFTKISFKSYREIFALSPCLHLQCHQNHLLLKYIFVHFNQNCLLFQADCIFKHEISNTFKSSIIDELHLHIILLPSFWCLTDCTGASPTKLFIPSVWFIFAFPVWMWKIFKFKPIPPLLS